MRDLHYGRMCFKSVKSSELYILSCGNGLGLRPLPFPAKNVELLGLYPIRNPRSKRSRGWGYCLCRAGHVKTRIEKKGTTKISRSNEIFYIIAY